jgi:hypothetical protein
MGNAGHCFRGVGAIDRSAHPCAFVNDMTLTVSDRKRSVECYQGLFGLPVQHRQGVYTGLRISSGPK